MSLKFTNEADEKLIDLVQPREYLYRASHKNYKNQQVRRIAWYAIGEQIERSGKFINMLYINNHPAFLQQCGESKQSTPVVVFYYTGGDCSQRSTILLKILYTCNFIIPIIIKKAVPSAAYLKCNKY